jgi:hypothetical protein
MKIYVEASTLQLKYVKSYNYFFVWRRAPQQMLRTPRSRCYGSPAADATDAPQQMLRTPRSRCYGRPAADATDAPQQMLRTHRSLKAYCATLVMIKWKKDDQFFFLFFQVMELRWNEIDRGKPKYSGKNLSQCHFIHLKNHMDRPGPPRWEAGD